MSKVWARVCACISATVLARCSGLRAVLIRFEFLFVCVCFVCVCVCACVCVCVCVSQVHKLQEKAGSSHVVLAAGGGMIQTTSQLLRK